ncbi:hypothetical protein R1sor_025836 [Riccia sorocarpa]|uniref:Uncharacterized protein n=1 Tax=Riccia sorocarpa TaxID=122646 RepID=A0ABD3G9Q8_9MARC
MTTSEQEQEAPRSPRTILIDPCLLEQRSLATGAAPRSQSRFGRGEIVDTWAEINSVRKLCNLKDSALPPVVVAFKYFPLNQLVISLISLASREDFGPPVWHETLLLARLLVRIHGEELALELGDSEVNVVKFPVKSLLYIRSSADD